MVALLVVARPPLRDHRRCVADRATQLGRDQPGRCIARQVACQQIDRELRRRLGLPRVTKTDDGRDSGELLQLVAGSARPGEQGAIEQDDRRPVGVERSRAWQAEHAPQLDAVVGSPERRRPDDAAVREQDEWLHGRRRHTVSVSPSAAATMRSFAPRRCTSARQSAAR
jgi:hypothetical protein